MEKQNANLILNLITLVLGGVALLVAIGAYNRTGADIADVAARNAEEAAQRTQDFANVVTEEAQETSTEARLAAARVAARTRLLSVQADIVAEEVTDETMQELTEIRNNLREAYADAQMLSDEAYMEIDQDLNRLESELRQDTTAALETVQTTIENLQRDISTDEQ